MMEDIVLASAVFLTAIAFISLFRAYRGPKAADRIVAINAVSGKVTAIIVLIALITDQISYVNVALIYAMIGFLATIGVAKYLRKGRLDA